MTYNDGWHHCHFCGEEVKDGKTANGTRHWLSDCRPDLVQHEPGPLCTWSFDKDNPTNCYAYQDRETRKWTSEHVHFYPDGTM